MPIYQPSDLGLILSYKCQSRCAHCIYNCSPDWGDWIAPDDIRLALEQALGAWGHSFQVHLTGGEPFLNFPLLKEAVEIAAGLGIPCYLETNAGWCVRPEITLECFMELRLAGLQSVLISCSPFHIETIPLSRVLLAAQAASQVFGAGRVMLYQSRWTQVLARFGLDETVSLERFVNAYGQQEAGRMVWSGYGLISGGRSGYGRLGELAARQPAEAFQGENCQMELLYAAHSHFDLYGNYIPGFCGGLSVGDWRELPDIREKACAEDGPALIGLLLRSGPYGIFRLACEEFGYRHLLDGYAGKCHLCVDVRRCLSAQGEFVELQPAGFYSNL
ncbi:MAG: hypothetical protein JXA13_06885 [Anaerolineales bacterium]|nr:hypothetical protein [Anaerolineales bacterium]